jgi:hypothetical protein
MDARRLYSPWRWFMFGLTFVILTVVAVAAFTHGAAVLGWIVSGILVLYLAARIGLLVALRRAERRAAITPLVPGSAERGEQRVRFMVITYSATFVVLALLAFIGAFLVPGEFAVVCWVLTGCFLLVAALMPVAWRVGVRRRAAIGDPHP